MPDLLTIDGAKSYVPAGFNNSIVYYRKVVTNEDRSPRYPDGFYFKYPDPIGANAYYLIENESNLYSEWKIGGWGAFVGGAGKDHFEIRPNGTGPITGGPGNDRFTQNAALFFTKGSASELYGGSGDDYIVLSDKTWQYDRRASGGDARFADGNGSIAYGDGFDSLKPRNDYFFVFEGAKPVAVGGDDVIVGGKAKDFIYGGGGNDVLYGGLAGDVIDGEDGNDFIYAGPRGDGYTDIVSGGEGADMFLLSYQQKDDGGQDFWSHFSEELRKYSIKEFVKEGFKSIFQAIAEGSAKESLLQTFAKNAFVVTGFASVGVTFATQLAELAIKLSSSPAPKSGPDILYIKDFDPSADVIVLPTRDSEPLTSKIVYIDSSPSGSTGWGIQFERNGKVYAELTLSAAYLEKMGITGNLALSSSPETASLLANVLAQRVQWTGKVDFSQGVPEDVSAYFKDGILRGEGAKIPSGTQTVLIGAVGPYFHEGVQSDNNNNRIGGTIYNDVLTTNAKLFAPDLWTTQGSPDVGSYLRGFAGADLLFGTKNGDVLIGDGGDDEIYTFLTRTSGANNKVIDPEFVSAGGGDDIVYTGNSGTGAKGTPFDGGAGEDTLAFFYGATHELVAHIDVPGRTAYETEPGSAEPIRDLEQYRFENFERFIGGPLGDTLIGAAETTIEGAAGGDELTAAQYGVGLAFSTSPGGVTAMLFADHPVLSGGHATGDQIVGMVANFTALTGSGGDDLLGGAVERGYFSFAGLDGADTFAILARPDSGETVYYVVEDFSRKEGDRIDLTRLGITSIDDVALGDNSVRIGKVEGGEPAISIATPGFDGRLKASDFVLADSVKGQAKTSGSGGGLVGGGAADGLNGAAGEDALFGNGGDDRLSGRGGHDLLNGGGGNDVVFGGAGADRMSGGKGADEFRLRVGGLDGDVILDFNPAKGDRILLESLLPVTVKAVTAGVFELSAGTLTETIAVKGAEVADFQILA